MREIKFRVWRTDDNRMYDTKLPFLIYTDGVVPSIAGNTPMREHPISEAVLLQYTALKDKNGVEIYEGDIVREYTGFSDEGGNYPVEYHSNGFWLEGRDNEFGFGDESDMQVIGNIYQNPELL